MSKVPFVVWVSCGVLIVVVTLGSTVVFHAVRQLWRDMGSFGTAVDDTFTAVSGAADRLAVTSALVTAAVPRLDAATARLRVAVARLAVLRAAVGDVQESISGVVALYPRK